MIGFFNYTTWLTYLSLLSATFGIFSCINGDTDVAIYCLLLSGFLDTFDGKVARSKKNRSEREKSFGVQIDSLTDLVCFGVLPVCVGLSIGLSNTFWYFAFGAYVLAGMIRLAFFNVLEEERKFITFEQSKGYIGLPITTASLIFPITYLLKHVFPHKYVIIYGICMIITSCLFITKMKIKKPGVYALSLILVLGATALVLIIINARR